MFRIPAKPPPRLANEDEYSADFVDFLSKCLTKKATDRPQASELLEVHNALLKKKKKKEKKRVDPQVSCQHPFVKERKQIAEAFAMNQIIRDALERIQLGHLDELQDAEATFEGVMDKEATITQKGNGPL